MKLQIGELLPGFSLADQDDQMIAIQDFVGRPLVIFFYPKDDTPVCTIEACTFESNYNEFKNLDAEVFGISADSVNSHKRFATKHGLTFKLLSDSKNEVEKLFGVKRNLFGLLQERITFIFDEKGILIHSFQSQLNGKKHIREALLALKNANSAK
ncbi:MAG: peroxiredoxin [Reichenbachiella sp.]|uniref:peroxiredoxin n=1 Tax=Reichenbachiella sp. TaxID=2184521 RepID=UPI003266B18A